MARSSTCAEVQACGNAYDEKEFVKHLWYEIWNDVSLKRMNSDVCAASIPGAVFCDAKNVYDCADRILSSGLQLEERRLCLEIVSIRERKEAINSPLRWVDSDQQYADDRTKVFAVDKLLEILRKKTICVMFDPSFISAQKKRQIKSQEMKNEQVQPEINYTHKS